MRRRFYLIENAIAGRGEGRLTSQVCAALTEAGGEIVRGAGGDLDALSTAAYAAAHSGEFDAIIAAGGDGTIRFAAEAAAGSSTPVGVIPLGTGNVLAHEVGLPREARAIARLLIDGEVRPVRTARVNERLFLLMAGVGFDGAVIDALDHALKNRIGKFAYVRPALRALAAPPVIVNATIDGEMRQAHWVVVANASRYGGGFHLARQTHIERSGLVAVVVQAPRRADLIATLAAVAAGRIEARPNVEIIPCSTAVIKSFGPVPVQIDGDREGSTPLIISADGPSVGFVLPPKVR
jgi:diacylglycerol kinase (ATP)